MSRKKLRGLALSGVATLALFAPRALQAQPSALTERVSERIEALEADLIEIRHDLHRHPEVSGAEERTSGIVAERLRALGFEVRSGVGGHGVVGRLDGADPGPVVAFRADMDAVPSNAPDPVEFRSETPGVRHICGHDIHTTVGLALAEGFAAIRDELAGSLVVVFQPAEENATGARAMVADKALEPHAPDAIYALHTAPLEVGTVAVMPGMMMASRDRVQVRATGNGDLDAAAKAARDAVIAVGNLPPAEMFGIASNPDFINPQLTAITEVDGAPGFGGTITTATRTATEQARAAIEQRLEALETDDVHYELEYEPRWIAGVDNNAALTTTASASVSRVLGEGSVLSTGGVVPAFSEDFGSFQESTPGVMFFLGVSNSQKGIVGMPHSPGYVADDASIAVGARAMAAVILDHLESAR